MKNIPQQYQVNRKVALKTVLSGVLKPSDKKRLRTCLKGVHLTHQIHGESIPSYIDEQYHYEVIMFLDVRLDDVKRSESIAAIVQRLFKPPCVIRFFDESGEKFSFADKRISKKDDTEIIIEKSVVTSNNLIQYLDEGEYSINRVLDFDKILNTINKRGFYIEVMSKAFVADNLGLYSKIAEFLDTSIWYNDKDSMEFLTKMLELKSLNIKKKKAVQIKDKTNINGQIKNLIEQLNSKLNGLQSK